MPDFFHVVHDIVKSYSLALGQRWRQAQQELTKAEEALARRQGQPHAAAGCPRGHGVGGGEASRGDALGRGARTAIGSHLETLSLTLHPFRIADSAPQTSAQVESQLHGDGGGHRSVGAVPSVAGPSRRHDEGPQAVAGPGGAGGLLVARGPAGFGARRHLSPCGSSGLQECLAPAWSIGSTKWPARVVARRKAKMRQALEECAGAFDQHAHHPVAASPGPRGVASVGDRTGSSAFQRASSAVEGRNGCLAQLHHNQRGLPKRRYKVWTVLHNFDCRAADGTTPAARFFRRAFPDLFETVLSHIEALPQPRRRKRQVGLSH